MVTMNTQNIPASLQTWAASRGGFGALVKADPQRVAQSTGVDISVVQNAQSSLRDQIREQTQALRDAGQGGSVGRGGVSGSNGAAFAQTNLGFQDTGAAMGLLQRRMTHRPLEALEQFRCSMYTEADAQATMQTFGLRNLAEAKAFIGQHMLDGTENVLAEKGITKDNWDAHDLAAEFNRSNYSEEDALAAVDAFPFLDNLQEAKEYIGAKILNGMEEVLADAGIHRDRMDPHELLSAFRHSSYSESDAQAAMQRFSWLTNIREAKEFIGQKIITGQESVLADSGITPQPWDQQELMASFNASPYVDAHAEAAVAAFPHLETVQQAREYIGEKIINGGEFLLAEAGITPEMFDNEPIISNADLAAAHADLDADVDHPVISNADLADAHADEIEAQGFQSAAMAAFDRAPYLEQDAYAAMEQFPHLSNLQEAKEFIGQKVMIGREDTLADVGIVPRYQPQPDHLSAFRMSTYTDLDARAVMNMLGLNSPREAKEYIGEKILSGNEADLNRLGVSEHDWDRHDALNIFARSGYSEADAQAAVDHFGFLSNVEEAKAYIGLKIVNGNEDMMASAGISREPFDRHDMLAAFRTSQYTVADAEAAVEKFSFLTNTQQAMEYIGLKIINDYEGMLADEGISPDNRDHHELINEFKESGLRNSDARKVKDSLGFLQTLDQAKAYIGNLLMEGNDAYLARLMGGAA